MISVGTSFVLLPFDFCLLMDLASINIIWLLILLVIINGIVVAANPFPGRFWHPAIILWLALFFLSIIFRVSYSRPVDNPGRDLFFGKTMDPAVWHNWTTTRERERVLQRKVFRLLVAQSFFSLFLMVLGYQQTGSGRYRQATISFMVISLLLLALEIAMLLEVW